MLRVPLFSRVQSSRDLDIGPPNFCCEGHGVSGTTEAWAMLDWVRVIDNLAKALHRNPQVRKFPAISL
jgi:hypothetical protein